HPGVKLCVVGATLAICQLAADAAIPAWATRGDFFSLTRTTDELSIVCIQSAVPDRIQCERGWRCVRVAGTMPFSVVGVLALLTDPLYARCAASLKVISLGCILSDGLIWVGAEIEQFASNFFCPLTGCVRKQWEIWIWSSRLLDSGHLLLLSQTVGCSIGCSGILTTADKKSISP